MSYSFANDPNSPTRPMKMRDQHNRLWLTFVEKRNGGQCGLMSCAHRTPGNHAPPWLPDQRYFKFDPDDPTRFQIDYVAMLADRRKAHDDYHARAVEEATAREWTVPEKPEPGQEYKYEYKLTQIVGKPPKAIEPIVAAMQNNSWVLGFTDTVDERVAKYLKKPTRTEKILEGLPDFSDASASQDVEITTTTSGEPLTYVQFVAKGRKEGKTMQELAPEWKAYKAQHLAGV